MRVDPMVRPGPSSRLPLAFPALLDAAAPMVRGIAQLADQLWKPVAQIDRLAGIDLQVGEEDLIDRIDALHQLAMEDEFPPPTAHRCLAAHLPVEVGVDMRRWGALCDHRQNVGTVEL